MADVEAIAQRVAELLAPTPPARWVDAQTVARTLDVEPAWVRAHAAELGAVRLGGGTSGPLRFDVRRVEQTVESWRLGCTHPRQRRRPGPPRRAHGVELLPLPEGA